MSHRKTTLFRWRALRNPGWIYSAFPYVWSPQEETPWSPGDASRWWLHHSLDVLAVQLAAAGSRLLLRHGPAAQALAQLVHETGASQVHASGRCEPAARQQEKTVAQALQMAGARWFWDTLVDADLASNSRNWQWVAGCGADAAPYFHVFNPVLQGHRFDPEGDYVRRWVPELATLSKRHLHAPWQAPASALRAAGVRLGETYPRPIVDLATGRQAALAAYAQTGGATGRPHTPD